jgi:hypothetical protein
MAIMPKTELTQIKARRFRLVIGLFRLRFNLYECELRKRRTTSYLRVMRKAQIQKTGGPGLQKGFKEFSPVILARPNAE